MQHNLSLLLALVHSDSSTVLALDNALRRVCMPVPRDVRRWRNPATFLGEKFFRQKISNYSPSIVFADASAPSTPELLEALPQDDSVVVLCTTPETLAADANVRRLHERFGVDMLFLPFTDESVRNVVERSRNALKMKALLRTMESAPPTELPLEALPVSSAHSVVLPTSHGKTLFAKESIIYCKAQNKETLLCTAEHSCAPVVYHLLKEVGERLREAMPENEAPSEADFLRVHASYIVNRQHILRYKPHKNKCLLLTMSNGEHITVSETYKKDFLRIMQQGEK